MVNKTQVYDHNLIAPLVPQNRKLEKSVNGKMANAVEHESSHLKFKNGKAIDDAIQNAAMQSDTVISYKATLKEELVINEEVNSRKRKRSSQDSATAVSIIDLKGSSIAITGIRLTPQEEAKFNSLGIEVTDEITSASVLIAERVSRTEKFLMAISLSVPIVSSAWKDKLVSGSQIPSVENFILADPEGEKTYDFSMKNSVKTSKMINILKGFTIYCTPSVQPPIETITRLVEANAGYFGEIITRRNVQRIKEDIASFDGNTVCLSTASDFALIEKLGQKCYSTEWLLNSILRQDTSFLKNFQLKP